MLATEAGPAAPPRWSTPEKPQPARAASQTLSPFGRPLFTFLVLALPALFVGYLIFTYGVDTPWGDQWDGTLPLFAKSAQGTLSFADFFAFHNEHRILFPRLLTFAAAKLTHWNVRAELLIIWLLACVCSLNIWRLAKVTGLLRARGGYWFLAAANVLLFAPSQWENLLWGFQIGFYLPLAFMTALPAIAVTVRRPYNLLATGAVCLMTTFSIASGFGAWLLVAPLLLVGGDQRQVRGYKGGLLLWASVAVTSVYVYFHGYAQRTAHPDAIEALKHPIAGARFCLTYLGYPFALGTSFDASNFAALPGALLVAVLLASLAYIWRRRADGALLARCLPWVALSSIALLNAVLAMMGRSIEYGIAGAMQSRYVSFAIFLPISLLALVTLLVREHRKSRQRTERSSVAFASVATAMALLFLLASIHSMEMWTLFQHGRLVGKAALLLINVIDQSDGLKRYVHRGDESLQERANALDQIGYLHPPLLRSKRIRDLVADSGGETLGELQRLVRNPAGDVTAIGWASLPTRLSADSVLLTYDDAAGDAIIFARADVVAVRGEVTEPAWRKSWSMRELPEGARRIRAWAFDADAARAYPIGGGTL